MGLIRFFWDGKRLTNWAGGVKEYLACAGRSHDFTQVLFDFPAEIVAASAQQTEQNRAGMT